jgi:hypothetical protein
MPTRANQAQRTAPSRSDDRILISAAVCTLVPFLGTKQHAQHARPTRTRSCGVTGGGARGKREEKAKAERKNDDAAASGRQNSIGDKSTARAAPGLVLGQGEISVLSASALCSEPKSSAYTQDKTEKMARDDSKEAPPTTPLIDYAEPWSAGRVLRILASNKAQTSTSTSPSLHLSSCSAVPTASGARKR